MLVCVPISYITEFVQTKCHPIIFARVCDVVIKANNDKYLCVKKIQGIQKTIQHLYGKYWVVRKVHADVEGKLKRRKF